MLTPREHVLKAMRREVSARVPKYADFSPPIYDLFVEKTGVPKPSRSPWSVWSTFPVVSYREDMGISDPAEYFDYEVRIVEFGETKRKVDFSRYLPPDLPPGRTRVDEWGIAWVRGSKYHFERMVHPLADVNTIEELEEYPWPDVNAPYRKEVLKRRIEEVQGKGYAAVVWPPVIGGTFFETAWRMRGFEKFLIDMMINRAYAAWLLDKIGSLSFDCARSAAECGADIMLTGDDVGTEHEMLMSPQMWREWLKSRYAELIRAVKEVNPEVLIFYHSDGYIEPIIPELIEIGVDILNPVQPECMDPVKIKERYGDHLAFWGTVGTQTTFPHGTPAEVREVVKERIRTVGKGGGFLIAPTHKLQPGVPWENIVAFFEAVEEYGRYWSS